MHRIKRKHMQRSGRRLTVEFLAKRKVCVQREIEIIAFFLLHSGTDESHGRSPSSTHSLSLCCPPHHAVICGFRRIFLFLHYIGKNTSCTLWSQRQTQLRWLSHVYKFTLIHFTCVLFAVPFSPMPSSTCRTFSRQFCHFVGSRTNLDEK